MHGFYLIFINWGSWFVLAVLICYYFVKLLIFNCPFCFYYFYWYLSAAPFPGFLSRIESLLHLIKKYRIYELCNDILYLISGMYISTKWGWYENIIYWNSCNFYILWLTNFCAILFGLVVNLSVFLQAVTAVLLQL